MVDHLLLSDYARSRSADVFSQLVHRYLDLVYASARRQLRDAHQAEDVAQAVFMLLAKKAGEIPRDRPLSAWLLATTRYVVANIARADSSRIQREQKVAAMEPQSTSSADEIGAWDDVLPLLDEGLGKLSEPDRHALIFRFFESKTVRQTADELGISEAAAEKRISRAIDRLRGFFSRKGVAITTAGLVVGLSGHLLFETPATLAATIVQGGSASSAATASHVLLGGKSGGMWIAVGKVAACVIGALAVVGGSAAALHQLNAAAAPILAAAPPPGGQTQRPPTVDELYALSPGEPVKIVRDAPPALRAEMWKRLQGPGVMGSTRSKSVPSMPFAMTWFEGKPANALALERELPAATIVRMLAGATLSLSTYEVEFVDLPPAQMFKTPGDLVYSSTVPAEIAVPRLQTLLQTEMKSNISLDFVHVDRKVFVLKGHFTYHQMALSKAAGPVQSLPTVEIFGDESITPQMMSVGGESIQTPILADKLLGGMLAEELSQWVGGQVIIEADGFPGKLGWRGHETRNASDQAAAIAHDPARVLAHVATQTGLTWSQETRNVRRLIVTFAPPI
jgi:RNA polymerase sigma factor (sigma-70 family)